MCVGCRGSHSGTAHGRGVRNGCGIDLMCLLRDMWACGHLYSCKSELLHINVHVLHCIGKVVKRCVVKEIYKANESNDLCI